MPSPLLPHRASDALSRRQRVAERHHPNAPIGCGRWLLAAAVWCCWQMFLADRAVAQATRESAGPETTTATPLPQSEASGFTNHLGMEFVAVPGTHVLFCTTETTLEAYRKFLSAVKAEPLPAPHFEQSPQHPVVGISQADADAFCRWLTEVELAQGRIHAPQRYRLPTNDEWTLAVALVDPYADLAPLDQEVRNKTYYPWGQEWPPVANAGNFASDQIRDYGDDFPFTAPAGSFPPNRYGIYDLAGNAWEWCEGDVVSGREQWILRGGSWLYFRPECLLAGYEYRVPPGLRSSSFGFRCIFEDPDKVPELTRSLVAAKADARQEAQSRILGATEAKDLSPEEAAKLKVEREQAQQRLLLRKDEAGSPGSAAAGPDVSNERARFLERTAAGGNEDNVSSGSRMRARPGDVAAAAPGTPFENSLGMKLVPLEGTRVLLAEFETRVGDFGEFVRQNPGRTMPEVSFRQTDEHPVVKVSWNDAGAFCEWLTGKERELGWISETQEYRLPTDEEWSLAAGLQGEVGETPEERGGNVAAVFPWGDQWPPQLNSVNLDAAKIPGYTDKAVYTAPVAAGGADPVGVSDLGGNVSEWCWDNWNDASSDKVIRGGSWISARKEELQSSWRTRLEPGAKAFNIGFRCVLVTP